MPPVPIATWSGSWTGHNAPIANMLHHYMITEPLPELIDLAPELPVVRDPYSHAYLREESNGVLVGPYETATAHVCWERQAAGAGILKASWSPEVDRLTPWLENAAESLPFSARRDQVGRLGRHHPYAGRRLSLRPGARAEELLDHCGASIGICQGGGRANIWRNGWCMARPRSTCANSIRGASAIGRRKDYTAEVSVADYHHMYYCYKPAEQHEVGRGLRKSSLYDKLKAEGAQFCANLRLGAGPLVRREAASGEAYSYRRSNWFEPVRRGGLAVPSALG